MESQPRTNPAPPRFGWLYALPGGVLPPIVEYDGRRYEWVQTFKHDFFAATGLYRGPEGLCVLKLGRATSLGGLPLGWIGRLLARREIRFYEMLAGMPGVPGYVGPVGRNGFLHLFVPGRPLGRYEAVDDEFFPRLQALLAALHERGIAYVDLNKRQNILRGDDGSPYLIDFQISLYLPRRGFWGWFPFQWVLRRFQRADCYHVLKHKRRLRPDQLTEAERAVVERLSIWIRLHRLIFRPITRLRRIVLAWLRKRETAHVAGSDAK